MRKLFTKSDLKHSFRLLVKSPGFTLLSILVLAGGLGLSVFTFTLSYTMAYKTIPLENGESIVEVCTGSRLNFCWPFKAFEFAQIRQNIRSLENVGIYVNQRVAVESDDIVYGIVATRTEWNMFALSATDAALGRTLQSFDQNDNAEPVVVLGHDFWQQQFNADSEIVGKLIAVESIPTRVVGIMPEGYRFPAGAEVWLPATNAQISPLLNDLVTVSAYGRLKSGVSRAEASTEVDNLMRNIRQLYPPLRESGLDTYPQLLERVNTGFVTSLPMKMMGGIDSMVALAIMNLLAGLVFLLACINTSTLLLARTNERLKDTSIRVALGAPRLRLLLQTMGESILIAVGGALIAVLVAGVSLEVFNIFISSTAEGQAPFWWNFAVDESTLIAVVVFSLFMIMVTSAIPNWRLINGNFNSVMQDGSRGAVGLRSGRFSRALVVIAIAMITLLLYLGTLGGTALLSFNQVFSVVDSRNLHSATLNLGAQYDEADERLQFNRSVLAALVQRADVSEVLMLGSVGARAIEQEGEIYAAPDQRPTVPIQTASGALDIIGSTLLEGRSLSALDGEESERVAVISQSLAERLWPDESAIGKSLRVSSLGAAEEDVWRRVVGVTTDTPVTGRDMFAPETNMVYLPLNQVDAESVSVLIRSVAEPGVAARIITQTVHQINSAVSVSITDWAQQQQANAQALKFGMSVIIGCGAFSFLLAITGIFGLAKNDINVHARDIATRRALGATDRIISRTFVLRGSRQVLIGFVLAMLAGLPFTMLILQAMGPQFLLTAILAAVLVISVLFSTVLIAVYHPIRRVLAMEPSEALKYE
ncbi:MAG: ABC transporter permease [Gammaproteobacteria bacterium]|nr:ABC transporter permease [Gammaproteobacteria bacterium]MDP2347344.1 ABC transporter permease [Gammaproteobacteria bacterium]